MSQRSRPPRVARSASGRPYLERPERIPDEVEIDSQPTLMVSREDLWREVMQGLANGPLPVAVGDISSTGPLPIFPVDPYATHPLPVVGAPPGRLRRITLVPTHADEHPPLTIQHSTREVAAGTDATVAAVANAKAASAARSPTFSLAALARSSGVYALSALAAPLVSLVLAPFLTRNLTPSEYGILAVLNTAVGLMAGISQLGLGSAFFRSYSYDYSEAHDRKGVISTTTLLLGAALLPMAALAFFTAPELAALLFGDASRGNLVRLALGALVAQNLTVPGYSWLRAESRALYFSIVSIVSLLVSLASNLVLVGALHLGINGAIAATGGGYIAAVLCTLPAIVLHAGLRFRRDVAARLLAFGLPLVWNFAAYWVLQLSDRYLLSRMGTLSETASYAVAYSLGSVLSTVIISPFILAWPTSMYAIAKRPDAGLIFAIVFRAFGALLLFAAFGLSLVATFALHLLFPPGYGSAAPIIAVISGSIVFYGVYFIFMIGANVRGKTWIAAVFTTVSAVLNLGLNFVLIPHFGGVGAAASTLLAYGALSTMAYVVNQRIYPLPLPVAEWLLSGGIGVALYIACWLLPFPGGVVGGWSGRVLVLAIYGLVLFFRGGGPRVLPLLPIPQLMRQRVRNALA